MDLVILRILYGLDVHTILAEKGRNTKDNMIIMEDHFPYDCKKPYIGWLDIMPFFMLMMIRGK